jgi:hypothetical protein
MAAGKAKASRPRLLTEADALRSSMALSTALAL